MRKSIPKVRRKAKSQRFREDHNLSRASHTIGWNETGKRTSNRFGAFYNAKPVFSLGAIQEPTQRCSGRFSKTECDIKVHPDDYNDFLLRKSFRIVGTGKPKIEIKPELKKMYPCLYEATIEHEKQHVRNSEQACQDFKKCIEEQSSGFFGEPKISYENFVKCHNKHHGGLTKDCIADEKSAYEEGIKKANMLINKLECAKEKNNLKQNIEHWEKIKDNAPNCKKAKKKSRR